MFCVKCGKQLEEGHAFCPNCGTPQQNNDSPTNKVVEQQIESKTTKTSSRKKVIGITMIAIILIFVGFIIFSGASGNKIVGKWTDTNNEVVLSFDKDNTGEMVSGGWAVKFTWQYNQTTKALNLDFDMMNLPGKLKYNSQNDTLVFMDGDVLHRVKQ